MPPMRQVPCRGQKAKPDSQTSSASSGLDPVPGPSDQDAAATTAAGIKHPMWSAAARKLLATGRWPNVPLDSQTPHIHPDLHGKLEVWLFKSLDLGKPPPKDSADRRRYFKPPDGKRKRGVATGKDRTGRPCAPTSTLSTCSSTASACR
jgi:hypothetical protein